MSTRRLAIVPLGLFIAAAASSRAEAATCRSDRITFVSEDGKREFIVTNAARALETVRLKKGKIVWEFVVWKGQVGDKTFYIHEDRGALTNTTDEPTGTPVPTYASERLSDIWGKSLAWKPWSEAFEEGEEGLWVAEGPEDVKGTWKHAACRGRLGRSSVAAEREWAREKEFIRRLNKPNLDLEQNPWFKWLRGGMKDEDDPMKQIWPEQERPPAPLPNDPYAQRQKKRP